MTPDRFFTRKNPYWRLRFATDPDDHDGVEFFRLRLQALTEAGHLASATETIYEPEVHAFGGPDGMTVAHRLFHADSRHILAYLRTGQAAIGKRELSVLLCSTLLRGAGQDWYEQGDVWARVTEHQSPLPTGTPPDRLHRLRAQLRRLMITDTSPGSLLPADAEPSAAWITAFAVTGRALRDLADTGALRRGLRAVLAHHVLFHWNRLGLDPHTKTLLAHAATDAMFTDDTHRTTHPRHHGGQSTSRGPTDARQP
ncbi:thiopeptide-type bacteriocin biosynthesis protein [Actinosynnema sp. NPDC050801]|uniref:thiopeptide-type bacteriocin biosynthesis protein n=1 Tax=unclassified Actinosynnema TaxID=2637065 RepID=UPI0033EA434D